MTELALDPATCGYVVFWRGDVCEWEPEDGRLYAQEGSIPLFADRFAAETAVERTHQSAKRFDSTYVADRREWRISPVRRVRAKEEPRTP